VAELTSRMRAELVYARAATSWAMLGITLALILILLTIVARWPYTMWPLHGAAIGLIAGTSAWAVDETTATIVDVAPRPMWWRHLARAITPLILTIAWTSMHVGIRDRLPDRLGLFILQGVTAAALGFAAGSALRSRGLAEPGQWIASFVCPLALGVALAKPLNDHAPLFPVWPYDDWTRSTILWSAAALTAVLLVGRTLWSDTRSA
jgi:hypothetical protein